MGSVTRPRRASERRRAVAERVGETVERLLREGHGYTGLGVQRIAEEAGIARSTFYLHFPDKPALLIDVAAAATEDLFAAARTWLEHGFADRAMLERTIAAIVAQQREHDAVLAAVVELAAYDEDVAAFWRARVGGFVAALRARIEEGQREGLIDARLDAQTTAAWITWGTERLVAQHVAERGREEDEQLAAGLARAVQSTLGLGTRGT